MEKFTASNGISVANLGGNWDRTELLFEGQSHPSNPERRRTRTFDDEDFLALREFFLHERDQELGRWRWPENPDYVVYPIEDQEGVWVLNESLARGVYVDRSVAERVTSSGTLARQAARAYFATHPEKKPWHDAKPGEVWAVTWDGHETPCHVVENAISSNGLVFNDGTRETPGVLAPCITHARRIWPEEEK